MKRHYHTFGAAVCLCVSLGLAACGPEGFEVDLSGTSPGQRQRAITDGTLDPGHPSVGFLLAGGSTTCADPALAGALCTATLVGQRTVVAAAHCILAGKLHIFCLKPGGSTYAIEKLIPHPQWDSTTLQNDVSVVILKQAPPVTPSIVSDQAPYKGLKITLVGFGITADGLKDAGTKRIATNVVSALETKRFAFAGTGSGTGSTCKGDSGGPAFATLGGQEVQIGVTSAGLTPCGTLAYDTRLDYFYSWVKTSAGGDLYDGATDADKPTVSITSPADQATVSKSVSVTATVNDNVGVVDVGLWVDGQLKANKTSPPYTFPATLADGQHTLKVVAKDQAGNAGEAQVTVKVGSNVSTDPPKSPPGAGAYGDSCDSSDACLSHMCANGAFCTQACNPLANGCPSGADCLSAGQDVYVCGPPLLDNGLDGEEQALVGGCNLALGGSGAPSPLTLVVALGLLVLALRRRRR